MITICCLAECLFQSQIHCPSEPQISRVWSLLSAGGFSTGDRSLTRVTGGFAVSRMLVTTTPDLQGCYYVEDAESPLDFVLERDHKLLVEVTMGDGDWGTVRAELISPATTLISQFGVFFLLLLVGMVPKGTLRNIC